MPINILMPALSPTMEEGKLAKWLVKEGDAVSTGDIIAEIETDKATMEVEAIDEGTIGKLLVEEGSEGVKVNTVIAVVLEEGEDATALDEAMNKTAPPVKPAQGAGSQQTRKVSGEAKPPTGSIKTTGQKKGSATMQAATGQRIFVSPLARRLAAENAINLDRLTGTGPHGRIIRRDVEKAIKSGVTPMPEAGVIATRAASHSTTASPIASGTVAGMSDEQILSLYEAGSYDLVPHDAMRKIIAERLVLSKQTIPHFYLKLDCRLDELLSARKRMNDGAPKEGHRAFRLSVNDFIIKAMALALQAVPAANATWTDGGTLWHKSSDVGVAVAVDGGLFTPVIRRAHLKTLSEISNEMKDLAKRARSKRLAPHEYQGGTTSISNLGMYGVKSFDAVINPPHATILAVGAAQQEAIVVDGQVMPAVIMSVTLSCDHRVVDGAVGAELLAAFKRFIEDPVRMLA